MRFTAPSLIRTPPPATTPTVFEEWGIHSCEDFGNMVFLMVENNLLRKQEQDRPEAFREGYSFDEAFRQPFLPMSKKQLVKATESQASEVEKN